MNDEKLIASIIKNLERTIGILENCEATGEMSEATRRRIIEILNSSTLDIYFLKSASPEITSKEVTLEVPSLTKNPISNILVEKFVEQEHQLTLAPNVHEEQNVSALHEVVEEIEADQASEDIKPLPYSDNLITNEKVDNSCIASQSIEECIDQTPPLQEEFDTYSDEEDTFNGKTEDPIFELEQDPIPACQEEYIEEENENIQNTEDETIEDEKQNLEEIRYQLEQERLRLEAELENWNLERQKREDEMRAAERLLVVLAKEQEKRREEIEKNQKTIKNLDIPDYSLEQKDQEVSKKQEPPIKKQTASTKKQTTKTQEKNITEDKLINNFLGNNKKFLHENFEVDDINVQGLAPVSDLMKVIGINDKFQFIKELFGGDSDLYIETISKLNTIGSYDAGVSYIFSNFQWDKTNATVKRILTLLKRRYM